jgi:hypothetical protein
MLSEMCRGMLEIGEEQVERWKEKNQVYPLIWTELICFNPMVANESSHLSQ